MMEEKLVRAGTIGAGIKILAPISVGVTVGFWDSHGTFNRGVIDRLVSEEPEVYEIVVHGFREHVKRCDIWLIQGF